MEENLGKSTLLLFAYEKECVLTRGGLTDVAYAIEYWRPRLKQDLS